MLIRKATEGDLPSILKLGKEFGHQMYYQTSAELLQRHLREILVAVGEQGVIEGFYHFLLVEGDRELELLRCYKQFPKRLEREAGGKAGKLCVCMQGASHRDVFKQLINFAQDMYSEIWCWCSLRSQRPGSYKELGFTFDPQESRTFYNIHKGDISTYRLGRWTKTN